MHFTVIALEYTSGNNVSFLDFIKNLIISIDRVPKISMGIYEEKDVEEDDSEILEWKIYHTVEKVSLKKTLINNNCRETEKVVP